MVDVNSVMSASCWQIYCFRWNHSFSQDGVLFSGSFSVSQSLNRLPLSLQLATSNYREGYFPSTRPNIVWFRVRVRKWTEGSACNGWTLQQCLQCAHDMSKIIEGLRERTEHLDIFLFSTHHSMVFYFRCSVYW